MTGKIVDLSDAQALTKRASKHLAEFKAAIGGDSLWRIEETQYIATSEWGYGLRLNRGRLNETRVLVADCANNLISALDQLAAALARSNGHQRLNNLYYPFGATSADYQTALNRYANFLAGYEQILSAAHTSYQGYVPHVAAVKEVSNTSKHWELVASLASAHGVSWQVPGIGQKIEQIPENTFEATDYFEFHRGAVRLNETPMNIVIKLSLTGLRSPVTSPDIILECALTYVQGVMSEVASKVQ